jgi:hypothetical protein
MKYRNLMKDNDLFSMLDHHDVEPIKNLKRKLGERGLADGQTLLFVFGR